MTNLAGAFMARPSAGIAEPVRTPHLTPRTPHIEIVPTRTQKRARPKIAYAAVVVTGVLAIVVTQLLLSIGLSDGAYEISSLQSQQKELDRSNQVLSEQFDKLSSPQNLAASAESLGMVTNSAPVYLRLSDGAVLGSPVAAGGTSVTGGQALVPNSLLTPPTVAGATAAGAGAAAAGADSAPPAPDVQPDVPWQGALPSPTTR
ncbi:hypothetical protein N1027_16835 [Herbiconiux sp. CPCC 205763]|uniref:Cell division protein FtsL n=1 Tax=Herbiconiux aconitum TaxID=2970913 RepID=A0ABT2GUB4_9MICO|nr:hypothetical protein [Herbiconiux aconitum]MCS5719802.1 hypothetical protein [Herbiconiux aconitum]